MWFSPHFAEQANLSLECLRDSAEVGRYSHDNLYHSLLGLFDVQSRVYRKELDLFAGCRAAAAAMGPGMTH
jgi:lipid A ethanolaminephosphotransferase